MAPKVIMPDGQVSVVDGSDDLESITPVVADCHTFCIAAAAAMAVDGSTGHTSFVWSQDVDGEATFVPHVGKVLKVTIQWVDESEAN